MKRTVILALLNVVALLCAAQQTFEASLGGIDRMTVVESSIDIPTWHEKGFWALYDKYLENHEQIALLSSRALGDLAKIDKTMSDQEAFDYARKMIASRYE